MKKIIVIIAVLLVAALSALAGCQKQEAPKPAEHSSMTHTAPMSMPTSTPTATSSQQQ